MYLPKVSSQWLAGIQELLLKRLRFFSGESLTDNIEMVPVFITTITNIPKRICKNDIPFFNEIFNFIVTVKFVIDEMFNSCLSN